MYLRSFLEATRVRADLSWPRTLEMTADSREATMGTGARYKSMSLVDVEPSLGTRRDIMQAEGGPQPEERHNLATELYKIDRRRKTRYGGLSAKYFRTRHLLRNGAPIHEFYQPLPHSVSSYR
jgi:hypothetical protein